MSENYVLEIKNLGKKYIKVRNKIPFWKIWEKPHKSPSEENEFWALKNIDFNIRQGEIVGVLGRNGAGKSTLLKILSQVTQPTIGEIRIQGRVGSLLEVGTGFNPDLSGRDNIYLSGTILGLTTQDIDAVYDQIVEFSGIGDFIGMPVKYYSSGMYTRLGYAVAAHLNHDILLIDEVLAVGDAEFQRKCMGHIHGETKSGRTILFVSHNMAAILNLCTRAIFLENGKIIADGEPQKVVDEYLSRIITLRPEKSWSAPDKAPGNATVRLKAVRLVNDENVISARLLNSEKFFVEIDYLLLKSSPPLGTTIVIADASGTCLFSSISNHEPEWHGKSRPAGNYRSRCEIPGDYMKEGIYSVTVSIWTTGYVMELYQDFVIDFEVVDSGHLRGDYFGGWEGFIQPRLNWSCQNI